MTGGEIAQLCAVIRKMFPTINDEQMAVLSRRIGTLPIDYAQAHAALSDEMLTPTQAKVQKVAAVWNRLSRLNAPTASPGAEGWKPPHTFAEVLAYQQRSSEGHVELVQNYILGIQAKCRERMGEKYAEDHAWKLWTIWRRDLVDAGMGEHEATGWLIGNTEVERAWAEGLYRRQVAGRTRQVGRMKRLADQWAAEDARATA